MNFSTGKFLFFVSFFVKIISINAVAGECPVEVFVIEKGEGIVEIGLKNNMKSNLEVPYDRLPWVAAGKGVDFQIALDGQRITKGSGAGQNTRVINIGPASYVSSMEDVRYLRIFYENVDKSRIDISWSYVIPGKDIPERCRFVNGKISPP